MSSQTHADAEDTISFFFFKALADESMMMRMASEVLAFSEYLVHYGAHFYLEELGRYEAVIGSSTAGTIGKEMGSIYAQMKAVGDEWGW
jgi:hypothetical protein